MEHHHHSHHHHHHNNEEDRQPFGGPPPPNNFADVPPQPHGLYQPPTHFDPSAPAPYRSEPYFEAPSPPPPNNFADVPPQPHGLYQPQPPFDPSAPGPYRSEPYFEAPAPPPPFGHVSHVAHQSSNELPAPYRAEPYFEDPAPPPPFGHVSHVAHQSSNEPYPPNHHHYGGYPPPNSMPESQGDHHTGFMHVAHHSSHQPNPYTPSGFDHGRDENRVPDNLAGLIGRATMKVYSKANPDYYLTIRDGKVILAPADPSDEAQHWYKDEKYSTKVKDADGHPCFALVNKATGEAMKHSVGATHPVHLITYDPDTLDESVLWTESKDLGDGYRTIRMVNNTRLNVDAYHGDAKSGGVCDGTLIVLWDWNKGDNQRWKIFPF